MSAPRVSVIVPAHNAAPYLDASLGSILEQSMPDLEILVIDDASTDQTLAIAREHDDPRVRVFTSQENRGPAHARNRGLAEARGEWIALLDADDWYTPARLETLLAWAQKTGAEMVADDFFLIRDGQQHPWHTCFAQLKMFFQPGQILDRYDFVARKLPMKPLIRREFLVAHEIRYNESYRVAEDFLFYVDCLLAEATLAIIPLPLYFYRDRPGSLMKDRSVSLRQTREVYLEVLARAAVSADSRLAAAVTPHIYQLDREIRFQNFKGHLKKGRYAASMRTLARETDVLLSILQRLPRFLDYRLGSRIRRAQFAGKAGDHCAGRPDRR